MQTRTRTSRLTFRRQFLTGGDPHPLPAGDYDLTIEETQIDGLSFEAWRRTATWLTVPGKGAKAGRIELRPLSEVDLDRMLAADAGPEDAR